MKKTSIAYFIALSLPVIGHAGEIYSVDSKPYRVNGGDLRSGMTLARGFIKAENDFTRTCLSQNWWEAKDQYTTGVPSVDRIEIVYDESDNDIILRASRTFKKTALKNATLTELFAKADKKTIQEECGDGYVSAYFSGVGYESVTHVKKLVGATSKESKVFDGLNAPGLKAELSKFLRLREENEVTGGGAGFAPYVKEAQNVSGSMDTPENIIAWLDVYLGIAAKSGLTSSQTFEVSTYPAAIKPKEKNWLGL